MGKPISAMSSSVTRWPDHRAWVSGSGSFAAARGQPALFVCVEAAANEGGVWRCKQGCRDPSAEARSGPSDRGARHPRAFSTAAESLGIPLGDVF